MRGSPFTWHVRSVLGKRTPDCRTPRLTSSAAAGGVGQAIRCAVAPLAVPLLLMPLLAMFTSFCRSVDAFNREREFLIRLGIPATFLPDLDELGHHDHDLAPPQTIQVPPTT